MGVSDASDGWIAGDGSGAGAIVWVRRRNGSWWPGRILGHDELPASHLMSPRSGTPVKLLGREDASVDWYNLEKSKRVKAFRCGEFDACIERVEASQGIPIKKREKYARREDAILHALELEKQQFEMKQQKPGIIMNNINNKTLSSSKIELNNCSSEKYTRNSQPGGYNRFANHKSPTLSGRVLSSPEEDNMGSSSYVHKGKSGKPFSREEDIPESIPRTRGLQDFGLRIAPSKKKHYQFVTWETLQKPADNRVGVLPFAGHSMGDTRRSGSSKNSFAVKRKSSQGNMLEDSPSKRRDRRRPLLQVLESSAKLSFSHPVQHDHDVGILPTQREKDHMATICHAKRNKSIHLPAYSNDILDRVGYSFKQIPTGMDDCHHQPDSLADEKTSSGLIEAFESDSSEKDYLESEMEKEGNLLRDTTQNLGQGSKDSNPPFPQMHPHDRTIDTCDEVGVSNWHMKGKRNIRRIDGSADKYNGPGEGTSYDGKGTRFKMGRMDPSGRSASGQGFYPKNEEFDYAYNEGDLVDRERRYPPSSKPMKDRGSGFIDSDDDSHLMGWGADGGPSHMARRIYREDSDGSDEMAAVLVDVDLKVQTSYQGERVPLVSLMSRLNGKAIIGHPVQVEMLEDGSSTGLIVSRNEPCLPESTAPAAVWKTARRTVVQRAPRSNPAPSALEADDSEPLNYSDFEGQPLLKKPQYSGYLSHQTRLAKTSAFHARGLASGKFQRKLLKRVSLSGQKTRMLSSLSAEQKRGGENLDAKLGGLGLIKPVEGVVPPITCVPMKVVFSRILESIGRPPSSAAHRFLVTGSETTRDPS